MKILVADDDPISRKVIEGLPGGRGLRRHRSCGRRRSAGDDLPKPDSPRLMVLDRTMPHLDGVDVCRARSGGRRSSPTYIIPLTGRGEREDIVEGFEAGADDYHDEAVRSSREPQARGADRRPDRRASGGADRGAGAAAGRGHDDSLTGLLNRSAFFDIFRKEVSRAERYETPLALIMADIDRFDSDTNGARRASGRRRHGLRRRRGAFGRRCACRIRITDKAARVVQL